MSEFLNWDQTSSGLGQQQPVVVQDGTEGMSFTELFQHYLAPEVAKLPSSFSASAAPPIASTSERPFAPENNEFSTTFDPSSYLPTIPGSPIGTFSPSSDNSGQRYGASMSPMSFPDLDIGSGAPDNDWALDPSLFGGAALSAEPLPELIPSSTATSLPMQLPPLPVVEEEPAPVAAPIAPTPAPAVDRPQLRAKRNLSASVTGDDDEEDEEDDGSDSDASVASTRTSKRRPAAKKAKAATGKAKTPKTSVAAFATPTLHHTSAKSNLPPVPEWTDKPDPETYKKLNSKEKRQLRNKISARNFRHRRKEHLQTLEEEISSRDTIISQLRDEVGVMRTENSSLRGEVTMLKQKWDEMMEKMASFAVPAAAAPTTSVAGLGVNTRLAVAPVAVKEEPQEESWALDSPPAAPEPLPTRRTGTRGSNGIAKPNLSKDVAPGMGRRTGSWTTQGMGGGFTSVHTTLLPEFNLLNKPMSSSPFSGSFNPAINALSAQQIAQLPSHTSHLRAGIAAPQEPASQPKGTFEDFFQSNPFWLRQENVEEYRASLYGKLAHNAAGAAASQKMGPPSASGHLPLPSGFRPAFFTAPPPPYSEKSSHSDLVAFQSPALVRQQENAYIANLATQTLFSRMASAFVDAFSGSTPALNGDKVASVLAGTSRLQLVPSAPASSEVDGLGLSLGSLSLESSPRSGDIGLGSCSFEEMKKRWSGVKKEI